MQRSIRRVVALTAVIATLSGGLRWGLADEVAPVAGLQTAPIQTVLPGPGAGGFAPFGIGGWGHALAGRAHCGHVIDLLIRNHMLQRSGIGLAGPGFAAGMFPGGFGPGLPPELELGDMELLAVGLIAEGSPECGPLVEVTFRNNSVRCVRHFSISAVAVLGHINITSPIATVEVPEIEAGATATVQIQLPVTAMAMTMDGTALAPFDTLVVVLDSFDELIEINKLNNVAILPRAELALVGVAAEPPVEGGAPVAAEPPVAGGAPVAGGPVDQAPIEGAPPAEAVPAPGENPLPRPANPSPIDFDSLDLEASAAVFRIR